MKKLEWLQALRGVAALMVLFFHMAPHWQLSPLLARFVPAMKWGFSGVDIFFALSGFVVCLSARRAIETQGAVGFILRRCLRIYLGYWPVLMLLAVLTLLLQSYPMPPVDKILRSVFLLYPKVGDNWLAPAWSLTFELYFYAWIVLAVHMAKDQASQVIAWIIVVIALWNAGWTLFEWPTVTGGQQPLRFFLTGLGIEFLTGSLLAEAYRRYAFTESSGALLLALGIALASIGLSAGSISSWFDRVEILRAGTFGLVGIGALIAALGLTQRGTAAPAWLVNIGDASFSLYLLHTILLDLSGGLRTYLSIGDSSFLPVFLLSLPIAIVAVSMLWFRYIELPLMGLLNRLR